MTQGARLKLAALLQELRPDWGWNEIDSALWLADMANTPAEFVLISSIDLVRRKQAEPEQIPRDAQKRWTASKSHQLPTQTAAA